MLKMSLLNAKGRLDNLLTKTASRKAQRDARHQELAIIKEKKQTL